MTEAANPVLVDVARGDFVDARHRGAWAAATPDGAVVAGAGDVARAFLPRSAIKPLQALPMVESGAADVAGLEDRRLALACASHEGSAAHVAAVAGWLDDLGFGESDLRCGVQTPGDRTEREALRAAGAAPSQLHNNCSGKHAGFLTLARRLGADPAAYLERDAPVQTSVHDAFAEATRAAAPLGWATDGCSAPNFATTLAALAGAAARMASPLAGFGAGVRARAAERLVAAMIAYPVEVAGEGRACTDLIRAAAGRAAVKTGAEGCFLAILPEAGLGLALKIDDGDTAAADCAIAALLVRFGALDGADPGVAARLHPPLRTRRGEVVGGMRPTDGVTKS